IGTGELTVHASAGEVADAIRKSLRVVPPGRPESFSVNGTLGAGAETMTVRIPEDAVDGSVDVRMKLYPSTFSELLDGLEGIFRQPYGCFEQTSSATYPNVMALAYMRTNDLDNPEVRAKATRYVQMGYQRLLSFEVADGGFSLFGQAPARLTLTAYGMAQFTDMAKVYPVDPGLLERVSDWLAEQQDSDGSWSGALPMSHYPVVRDRHIAPTAYVTWALGSYDSSNPAAVRGARYVASHIDEVRDPHTLAICVLALLSVDGQSAEAIAAARRLAEMGVRGKTGEWVWTSSGTSMTFGSGRYADVETTALAAMALFRAGVETRQAHGALNWLVSNRSPRGGWGTTQSTVLALKALLAGAGSPQRRSEPAVLSVVLDDAPEGAGRLGQVEIRPEQSDVVHTLPLGRLDAAGAYRLRLSPDRAEGIGYQIVINYRTLRPPARPKADGSLTITADYDRTRLEVGGTVRVHVEIANNGGTAVVMPLADVGTPPGFAVRPAGLDKAVADGRIERYSITARGVILYLDNLQPGQRVEIDYEMVARMPLRAVSAPTRVYAYYDPQTQAATSAVRFTVE
ncbi:MAG: hypothetical protein ACP5HU_12845, partial [Phycisphaerae bacterium]